MPNVANSTVVSAGQEKYDLWLTELKKQGMPKDLEAERVYTAQRLKESEADLVSKYGQESFDRWYTTTMDYYSELYRISASVPPGSGTTSGRQTADVVFDDLVAAPEETSRVVYRMNEVEIKSAFVSFDERNSLMRKVLAADVGTEEAVEIRPFIRRLPNETPFFLRMVDSNMQPCIISMSAGAWYVSGVRLSPNPESISINSAKVISRYQTMSRWVEDHWGDEIDVISLSGSTFSFFGYGLNKKFPGLVAEARGYTEAYKSLRSLLNVFSADGFILQDAKTYDAGIGSLRTQPMELVAVGSEEFFFDPDNASFKGNHPREGLVKERLYMNLVFDYLSCYGYVDTFDIAESSASPFRMTYTMVFKSEKTIYRQGSIAGGP